MSEKSVAGPQRDTARRYLEGVWSSYMASGRGEVTAIQINSSEVSGGGMSLLIVKENRTVDGSELVFSETLQQVCIDAY